VARRIRAPAQTSPSSTHVQVRDFGQIS
jgi:hypothetical protein